MAFDKKRTLSLKGAAIILMIFHHCFRAAGLYSGYTINFFPLAESQINHICTFFKLCVGTFAFISGYGLELAFQQKQNNVSSFCAQRYLKTISGFWPVCAICLIVGQLLYGSTANVYFGEDIFTSIFYVTTEFLGLSRLLGTPTFCAEWWYLSAAAVFIFLVPVFQYAIHHLGTIPTIFLTVALPRVLGVKFQGGTQVLSFLMPFLLGMIFGEYHVFDWLEKLSQNPDGTTDKAIKTVKILVLMLALAVGYKLYYFLPFDLFWEIQYGCIPAIFILFFNELIPYFPRVSSLLSFLGKHSANMYFVHTVLRTYLKDVLYTQRWFVLTPLLLIVFSLLFSIGIEALKKALHYDKAIGHLLCALEGRPGDEKSNLTILDQARSGKVKMNVLQKLKEYQFLFEELVKRDFKKKYKRTILGMLWSVLQPLLTLLVMRLVFTQFFGRNTAHYTTYLFCGNLVFSYFNESTNQGMTSLMGNAGIFTKVNVPKYLFLLSKNVQTLINFGLTLCVFFVFCMLDNITFTWKLICLLYPICCLVLFNIGLGLILSALFVFFRDIQYLWSVFTMLLMYMSAIFYTIDSYSYTVQCAFLLNPVYLFIRYFRKIVIEATIPTIWFHLLMLADTAIVLGIGCWMYKKYNHRFLYYV